MLFFGHLGVGSKLVSPWTSGLPRRAVLLGTILPDLIDKPLYIGLALVTGKRGAELGLISGSRTLGHTAILLVLLAAGAIARRSKVLAALALGMATHLFLDNLSDRFLPAGHDPSALVAMAWPFMGSAFVAIKPHPGVSEWVTPFLIGAEIIGIGLLAWDHWKLTHEGEILEATQERRRFFKRVKRARKTR